MAMAVETSAHALAGAARCRRRRAVHRVLVAFDGSPSALGGAATRRSTWRSSNHALLTIAAVVAGALAASGWASAPMTVPYTRETLLPRPRARDAPAPRRGARRGARHRVGDHAAAPRAPVRERSRRWRKRAATTSCVTGPRPPRPARAGCCTTASRRRPALAHPRLGARGQGRSSDARCKAPCAREDSAAPRRTAQPCTTASSMAPWPPSSRRRPGSSPPRPPTAPRSPSRSCAAAAATARCTATAR